MVESTTAQSITKPDIPEFTVKYVDNSYDIAPTYTIDPYTNNTVIQTFGSHVDNRTLVVTISNGPFTPFTDSNGNNINMFYNVRYKGAFGQDWTEMYGVPRTVWYSFENPIDNYGYVLQDYSSQSTIALITPPVRGQIDIQVEALVGYTNRTTIQGHIFMSSVDYIFYGQESGWSSTQTITIPEGSVFTSTPTPSSNPTTTPTTQEPTKPTENDPADDSITLSLTSLALIVTIVALITSIVTILAFRKPSKGAII